VAPNRIDNLCDIMVHKIVQSSTHTLLAHERKKTPECNLIDTIENRRLRFLVAALNSCNFSEKQCAQTLTSPSVAKA